MRNISRQRKYIPTGYKERNAIYQLIDNYTLFYLRFLKNNTFDDHYWQVQNNSPSINAWKCEADKKKGLQGSQIDLLIVRDDQITNVCEAKYSKADFRVDYICKECNCALLDNVFDK